MSALALRLIACFAMLLDHIGFSFNILPLRMIGRIAFPIFLFLIYNGFQHTSNRLKYALRLALFALISQVPFSLFCYGKWFSYNGNVFFTLLIALLCIWSADILRKHKIGRWFVLLPAVFVFALYHFGYIRSDYGGKAILMIMVFYLFSGKNPWCKVAVVFGMFFSVFYSYLLSVGIQMIQVMLGDPVTVPSLSTWSMLQIFSLAALPFIFAYNGNKGTLPAGKVSAKLVQYGFYIFYPLHMVLLWVLRSL